jgi:muconate cycloisomerase
MEGRLKLQSGSFVMPHVSDSIRHSTRIRRIEFCGVRVPLKKEVKHASQSRTESENLVVRVELATGQTGYGEGVPRSYVTGETIESALAMLAGHDWARMMGRPRSFAEAVGCVQSLTLPEIESDPRQMAGNAARCALELALLDAYSREFGEPAGRAVDLASVPGLRKYSAPRKVRYGAAITASDRLDELRSAIKYRAYRFRDVKVKVGVDGPDDVSRVRWFRRLLGPHVDLRLDANEAWRAADLLDRVRPLLRFSLAALEQPVPHCEVEMLADLRRRLGVPVMLDESLCGYPDAVAAIKMTTADMLNVRLSKCGGIFPALRIIGLAQRSGIGLQLGCHPGETAILSAAGRHVACRIDGLSWVEGSYDRHILRANVTRQDITFGHGGWASPLSGPGLGIQIDRQNLESMITRRNEISYD